MFCNEPIAESLDVFLHIAQPSSLDDIQLVRPTPGLPSKNMDTFPVWKAPFLEIQEAPSWMFFICDHCNQQIYEEDRRFRCADCWDFDYCQGCFLRERASGHAANHAFYVCRGSSRLPQRNLVAPDTLVEPVFLDHIVDSSSPPQLFPQLVALEQEAFGANAWGQSALLRHHNPSLGRFVQCFVAQRRAVISSHSEQDFAPCVVGYIAYAFEGDSMHLQSIAIKTEWQGAGVGRLVFRHALTQARAVGADCKGVNLSVEQTNARALNMYLSSGFNIQSEHENYYGPERHSYGMRLELA